MSKLLYIALMLISPDVFAGIFDPPPTDRSLRVLGTIFGSNIGDIYLGGAPNPVLSDMIEAFNFIIVVVGTFIVSYVGVISTINTAQEGTAMGQKWSAVWIPMRSIMGMLLMVPGPASGYSMIQVTVMWIIVQGIGAADQIWNIALDGLAKGESVMSGADVKESSGNIVAATVKQDAVDLATHLLNATVCMEVMHRAANNPDNNPSGKMARFGDEIKHFTEENEVPTKTRQNQDAIMNGTSYFGVNRSNVNLKDVCGSIDVEGIVTKNDEADPATREQAAVKMYYKKQEMIATMVSTLRPLAKAIVEGDIQPTVNRHGSKWLVPSQKQIHLKEAYQPAGYFSTAAEVYTSMLSSLTKVQDRGAVVKEQISQGKINGWIMAGSFYFLFATAPDTQVYENTYKTLIYDKTLSNNFACDIKCSNEIYADPAKYDGTDNRSPTIFEQKDDILVFWKAIAEAAQYKAVDIQDKTQHQAFNLQPGPANQALALTVTAMADSVKRMQAMMNKDHNDPIRSHALFGKELMTTAESIWFITMGIAIGGSILAMIGIGGFKPWIIFFAIMSFTIAVLFPIAMILFTVGASLAVYTPLVPYIIFTATAIGWVLVVIEAIIAAPIIALGFITPSGDELGKITHGLGILANIFLRPMLMIFGFLLAGRVYKAIVDFVDMGLSEVFNTIATDVGMTVFSPIIVMIAYAAFVISLVNKCFSLIYVLPDKVLRWIGGPSESTDVSQILGDTKSATDQAAQQVGGMGSGASKLVAKESMKAAKEVMEKKEELAEDVAMVVAPEAAVAEEGGAAAASKGASGAGKEGKEGEEGELGKLGPIQEETEDDLAKEAEESFEGPGSSASSSGSKSSGSSASKPSQALQPQGGSNSDNSDADFEEFWRDLDENDPSRQ